MQIVSKGNNLHKMSNPIFLKKKNKKNISECRLLEVLPRVLSVKKIMTGNRRSHIESFHVSVTQLWVGYEGKGYSLQFHGMPGLCHCPPCLP